MQNIGIKIYKEVIFVSNKTWKEEIIESLKRLGGDAVYSDLYADIEKNTKRDLSSLRDYKAQIRGAIESSSSDSEVFKGKVGDHNDIFFSIHGLGKGHWGLRNEDDYKGIKINLTASLEEFPEGKQVLKKHLSRERNSSLILTAKNNFIKNNGSLFCEACSFNFEDKYIDEINIDFIEAHHLKPVSEMKDNETTNIDDIVMLCPNCHRMIHRHRPWISDRKDIKKILK